MLFEYLQTYFTNNNFSLYDKKLKDLSILRYNSQLWSIIKQYYFYLYNFKPILVKYPIETLFLNENTLYAFLLVFKALEVKKTYILDISTNQIDNKSIKQAVGYKYTPYNHIIFNKKNKRNAFLLGYFYKYNILNFSEDKFWKYDILTFLINNGKLSEYKKKEVICAYYKMSKLNKKLEKIKFPIFNRLEDKIKFINDNRNEIYKKNKDKINNEANRYANEYIKNYSSIIETVKKSNEFKYFCKEAKPQLLKLDINEYLQNRPISKKCFEKEVNNFIKKYKLGKSSFYK